MWASNMYSFFAGEYGNEANFILNEAVGVKLNLILLEINVHPLWILLRAYK